MKTIFAAAAVLAISGQAAALTYTNDFESTIGAEWNVATSSSFNSTTILGRFDNATAQLTLTGFNAGDLVTLKFDFYALDSWDGNAGGVGPDRFQVKIDGVDKLDSTFSNVTGNNQSYPNGYLAGNFAAQTGATDVDAAHGGTLQNGYYGNSLYSFGVGSNAAMTAIATSSTVVFTWTGSNLQGVGDESWGIDNVSVNAVPEPATLVMLSVGVLAIARRRSLK